MVEEVEVESCGLGMTSAWSEVKVKVKEESLEERSPMSGTSK